jgi:hypothetical protein
MSGEVSQFTGATKSPGLFGSGKAADSLFERAQDLGYLQPCEGPPTKGKSKPKYGRITEKGHKWLLEQASPRDVLEGLVKAFDKQSESLGQEMSDVHYLQSRLAELQRTHEELQRSIQHVAVQRREEVARLQDNLSAARKSAAAAVAELDHLIKDGGKPTAGVDLGWETEMFLRQWRNQHSAGCPLHELFKHLKGYSSSLTIGGFHDLLRTLYDRQRIRLTGWHDSPDRIPDPNLALFISSKVMYYADTPDPGV